MVGWVGEGGCETKTEHEQPALTTTTPPTHPQPPHVASPVPTTMNFSAARRRSASAFLRAVSESGFWRGKKGRLGV